MIQTRRTVLGLGALSVLSMAGLSACNANPKSSGPASSSVGVGATAAPITGGTIHILSGAASKEIHLDPAKSQNLGTSTLHLVVRALTSWKTDPAADTTVVPDLATDTGTSNDGGRTWTYTLKSGLKYADGGEISAADVKFGLERSFDSQLQGGLSYHKTLLVGGSDYKGPAGGAHLDSIEVSGNTITFHLVRAFADWPWIVSMPAFGPIPVGKGMGIPEYDHKPPSSGPYQVSDYQLGSKITMTRNPQWDKSTDQARLAAPDQYVFEMGLNTDTAAQRLINDQGDDKNAAFASISAALIPKINADESVKARAAVSASGAVNYLVLNTIRPGLKDIAVRKAISYVINKQQIQTINGGPIFGGAIASTLLPPGLQGHQQFNLFDGGDTGNLDKAKQQLGSAQVGTLTLVIDSSIDAQGQMASSVSQDLKTLGIDVKVVAQDTDTLTATQTESGDFDLTFSGWQADYPGAYAALYPLFGSDQIGSGNYNMSRLSDPAIDSAISAAQSETDTSKAASLWSAVDKQILEQAPVVPLYYGHQAFVNGSNTTNTYVPSFPTYPNVLITGLKSQ